MKNTKRSSTDELMAKLGASLKDSPLKAHARATNEVLHPTQKPKAVGEAWNQKGMGVPELVAKSGRDVAVLETPTKTLVEQGAEDLEAATVIGAGQASVRKGISAQIVAESQKPKEISKLELAEQLLDNGIQTQLIRGAVQGEGLREIEKQRAEGKLNDEQVKIAKETVMKGSERMAEQLDEMATLKKVLADMKAMQSKGEMSSPSTVSQARALKGSDTSPAVRTPAGFGPAGSVRQTASGWRTSTVGLYPEDYEKAYAAMSYLQQQTGQAVNLSRIVKIALRMMEVGPRLLEANNQIRAKDGRVLARVRG